MTRPAVARTGRSRTESRCPGEPSECRNGLGEDPQAVREEFKHDDVIRSRRGAHLLRRAGDLPRPARLVSILGLSASRRPSRCSTTSAGRARRRQDIPARRRRQVQSGRRGRHRSARRALLALWSASGYIGAFMRASNAIYDVDEGRPIWKTLPIRIGVTTVVDGRCCSCQRVAVVSPAPRQAVGNALGRRRQRRARSGTSRSGRSCWSSSA